MDSPRDLHHKLQERVTTGIARIEGQRILPLMRHFTITRSGTDMRVGCWCGKARVLEVSYPNQFTRLLNEFLWDHENCQAKEGV